MNICEMCIPDKLMCKHCKGHYYFKPIEGLEEAVMKLKQGGEKDVCQFDTNRRRYST